MKLFILFYFVCIGGLFAVGKGSVSGVVPLPKSKTNTAPIGNYRGKISGKVAPFPAVTAAVWLEGKTLTAPKSPPLITLSQENYQFSKYMVVVPKGAQVQFPNKDPDYHNIYSLSKPKSFDLGRYKPNNNPVPVVTFDKTGFVRLKCEIHEHMNANIVVVDSPHYTTTDASGNFILKGIPAGEYKLRAQIDKKKKWAMNITVEAGGKLELQSFK